MDYTTIQHLVKSAPLKGTLLYDKEKTTIYICVYTSQQKAHAEIIDMKNRIEGEITDEKVEEYYKNILDNFNKGLRPYEYKRTFNRCYAVEKHTILRRFKKIKPPLK